MTHWFCITLMHVDLHTVKTFLCLIIYCIVKIMDWCTINKKVHAIKGFELTTDDSWFTNLKFHQRELSNQSKIHYYRKWMIERPRLNQVPSLNNRPNFGRKISYKRPGPFKHRFKTGRWFEQKQKKGSSDQNSHNFW